MAATTIEKTPSLDSSWPSQMLICLQESAKPEPIKVACMSPPPQKPSFVDEEYHGKISRDDVSKLLTGKSGRYLIRESNTCPGDCILSFNFDEEIKHYKLMYDGNYFKTDSSDRDYHTITELMIDVLELCRRYKKMEAGRKKSYSKPHDFKNHTYRHPKWCDVCGNFMWGLLSQGAKCEDCGLSVHKSCKESAKGACEKISVGQKIHKTSSASRGEASPRKKSSTDLSASFPGTSLSPRLFAKMPSVKRSCSYYQNCLRALTTFSIQTKVFDFDNSLSKCFCTNCLAKSINKFETKKALSQTLLQNWCRFPLHGVKAGRKNVRTWEVAYYAINPLTLSKILETCLDSKQQQNNPGNVVVVTPSIAYVNEYLLDEDLSYKFRDTLNEDVKYLQTVLEVYVQPNSFTVNRNSMESDSKDRGNIGGEEQSDNHSRSSPILQPEYWVVSSETSLVPRALLVRMFESGSS